VSDLAVGTLHPFLATEIAADLRADLTPSHMNEIVASMNAFPVGVFRHATPLTDAEHVAFSKRLGPVERFAYRGPGTARVPFPEIVDQSNLDQDGAIFPDDDKRMLYKRANRLWHTDMSFHPMRATYSLLSAHVIPPGDAAPATEFADMRAAYDALPEQMKARLDGLVAEHDYYYSRVLGGGPEPTPEERASRPPARHSLVHAHPGSGRSVLYLASHISGIVGWTREESRALLDELMAFATQPRFVYAHVWRVGDVVMWDNLATMHRAMPFDDQTYRRDVRRTTIREGDVVLEAVF
jgi:alpha-ketoglutarate-dependent 2,4-dichlorophenoxyacetate dioxygenase